MILKALALAAILGAAILGAAIPGANDAHGRHKGEAEGRRDRPAWSGPAVQPSERRGNFRAWPGRRSAQGYERYRRRTQDTGRDRRRGRRDRRRRGRDEQDRARDAVRGGQARPLAEIITGLQNVCPGTFLGASLQRQGQGYLYRVQILRASGRRITFLVDAATGAIVGGRCR
ncbi:MAG: hypothetical protein V3T02_02115 [Alphaproteobacteria bacterium]